MLDNPEDYMFTPEELNDLLSTFNTGGKFITQLNIFHELTRKI